MKPPPKQLWLILNKHGGLQAWSSAESRDWADEQAELGTQILPDMGPFRVVGPYVLAVPKRRARS